MAGKGQPKTGGREPGTPNRATAERRDLARAWGPAAIQRAAELAGLMIGQDGTPAIAQSGATRLAALRLLLDRGYGRAPTVVDADAPFEQVRVIQLVTGVPREAASGAPGE